MMMFDNALPLVSVDEAAGMLGICRWTIYYLARRSILPLHRIGGNTFISVNDLISEPILTLGKAGKIVNRSWWTVRKWRDAGILDVYYESQFSKGRCSIIAVTTAKEQWKKRDGGFGAAAR